MSADPIAISLRATASVQWYRWVCVGKGRDVVAYSRQAICPLRLPVVNCRRMPPC